MKATGRRGVWVLLALVVAAGFSGCGHNLFTDESAGRRDSTIDKYWDGDSAIKTTESRKKASEMGFGYPTGNAQ